MITEQALTDLVADQVDGRKKSVGMVVGTLSASGRRFAAHGVMEPGGRPVDPQTLFELASATKAFTCVALADMVRRGEVALTDPVVAHLPPGVRVPGWKGEPMRLIHLAMHTSGLPPAPRDAPTLDAPGVSSYSMEQLFRALGDIELARPLGSKWEYSNFDTALLGQALAYRAATSYEALIAERITGPLGMADTTFKPAPSTRSRSAWSASGQGCSSASPATRRRPPA
jgi:serine-type D-Ala-D-Ala carboxypeptidase/endopeptidase